MSDPESSTSVPEEKSPVKEEEEEEEEENKDEKEEEDKECPVIPTLKKSPKKPKRQSNSDDSAEEKNGEEDSDEDKPVGLLDRPVEIQSGHRERKKVERLEMNFNVTPKDKKLDIPEGKGEKLGDCPRIEFQLQKIKADELKIFHRLLFNRAGTSNAIKRNIRRFSGFTFKSESPEYEKKEANLAKLTINNLKQICEVLDLERGGTKEDLISRTLEFLMKPKSSGKALPKSAKKSKSSKVEKSEKRKSNSKQKSKRNSKKIKQNLKESDLDSECEKSEKEESEAEKEDEENEEIEDKSDTSDYEPSKKKKNKTKSSNKKEKKPEKKVAVKRKKGSSGEESDSSDDEPLVKKVKAPPSDDELKDIIKKILDGANLEEVTMKSVCKQVYAKFPDHDLTSRKDFIKATVKTQLQV